MSAYNISIKNSEGSSLVSARTYTLYAMRRIKSETKSYQRYFQPNLLTQFFQSPWASALPKTQRNRADLLRTRFTMLWRSEIHMNLKVDVDALNRRRRSFCFGRTIYIPQGQWRWYACKCACVYGVCSVKNKIENETNTISNLTKHKLNSPNSFKLHERLY
jgi:hypothetical protein